MKTEYRNKETQEALYNLHRWLSHHTIRSSNLEKTYEKTREFLLKTKAIPVWLEDELIQEALFYMGFYTNSVDRLQMQVVPLSFVPNVEHLLHCVTFEKGNEEVCKTIARHISELTQIQKAKGIIERIDSGSHSTAYKEAIQQEIFPSGNTITEHLVYFYDNWCITKQHKIFNKITDYTPAKCSQRRLYKVYLLFCKTINVKPISNKALSIFIRSKGHYSGKGYMDHQCGAFFFHGLCVPGMCTYAELKLTECLGRAVFWTEAGFLDLDGTLITTREEFSEDELKPMDIERWGIRKYEKRSSEQEDVSIQQEEATTLVTKEEEDESADVIPYEESDITTEEELTAEQQEALNAIQLDYEE